MVDSAKIDVATKFAALPWRLGRESVVAALKNSLSRLGLSSVGLYQLHWFGLLISQSKTHFPVTFLKMAWFSDTCLWFSGQEYGETKVSIIEASVQCYLGFQIRFYPSHLFPFPGYIDGLGDAVEKGLVRAVGVSNYGGNSCSPFVFAYFFMCFSL